MVTLDLPLMLILVASIGLLTLLLIYLASPLLIRLTYQANAEPRIDPVTPANPLPDSVRQFFFDVHEAQTKNNFEFLGSYRLPDAFPNVIVLIALYVNRETKVTGVSASMHLINQIEAPPIEQFTSFNSVCADGSAVETSNQKSLSAFPTPKENIKTIHPTMCDLESLYQAHLAIRKHYQPRAEMVSRLDTTFSGDARALLLSSMQQEYQVAAAQGILRFRPGFAADSERGDNASPYQSPSPTSTSAYTPTWYGAFYMTWPLLTPTKQLLKRLRYRRDANLLAATRFGS